LDHLLAEADRQLGEQRAQADAFATRSGLMIAATAVLTGLLARSLRNSDQAPGSVLWIIGSAAVVGILVLVMSRLVLGPSPSQLSRLGRDVSVNELFFAKLVAVEANSRALLRTELVFFLQAVTTVVGIVALIQTLQAGS